MHSCSSPLFSSLIRDWEVSRRLQEKEKLQEIKEYRDGIKLSSRARISPTGNESEDRTLTSFMCVS